MADKNGDSEAIIRHSTRSQQSNESYEEVTIGDSEEDFDENLDDQLSLDDLVQEKNFRIEALEKSNTEKDEQIQLLQKQLNDIKTKHKDGIYWLQVELDTARRERDATEEQMAELMSDLKGMTELPDTPETTEMLKDASIENYERALAAMDNQIMMIKTSAGEVVKTLKEEIADLVEERSSMEVDLLNQLAALDNEKIKKAAEFEEEIKGKNESINRLIASVVSGPDSTDAADFEEYEIEIARLMDSKKKSDEKLAKERDQAEEEVRRLENENAKLETQLERFEEELELYHSENDVEQKTQMLRFLARERDEASKSLNHVAIIWEKADKSILGLADSMHHLRPSDNTPMNKDRERVLSTLETASLVHGQVKVSLLLIELKLRNHLHSLKNDRLNLAWAATSNDKVSQNMQSIQADVMKVVHQVEISLSSQIKDLEKKTIEETKKMKAEILERASALDGVRSKHMNLEDEIKMLMASGAQTETEGSTHSKTDAVLNGISKKLVDKLQFEVLRVLERVKEKNALIQNLSQKLREHKALEEKLKKDLKRSSQKSSNSAASKNIRSPQTGAKPTAKRKTGSNTSASSPPPRSPVKTPIQTKKRLGNDAVLHPPRISPRPSPKASPNSLAGSGGKRFSEHFRLKPSPREIAKPRVGTLLSPSSTSSPK